MVSATTGYLVRASTLYAITLPSYTETLVKVLTTNAPLSYVLLDGNLYYSNGRDSGRLTAGTWYPLGLPTPAVPGLAVTTGGKSCPRLVPSGSELPEQRHWRGGRHQRVVKHPALGSRVYRCHAARGDPWRNARQRLCVWPKRRGAVPSRVPHSGYSDVHRYCGSTGAGDAGPVRGTPATRHAVRAQRCAVQLLRQKRVRWACHTGRATAWRWKASSRSRHRSAWRYLGRQGCMSQRTRRTGFPARWTPWKGHQ